MSASGSLGKITKVITGLPGWPSIVEHDPPLDATPQLLAKLSANPFVWGYEIKLTGPARAR